MSIITPDLLIAFQQLNGGNPYSEKKTRSRSPIHIEWVMPNSTSSENNVISYYETLFQSTSAKRSAEDILSKYNCLVDNWDGYGALAPTQSVIKNSISFLSSLPQKVLKNLDCDDNITPNPNGTLSFEWVNEDHKIYIEIGDEKMNIFSLYNDHYTGYDGCEISYEGVLESLFAKFYFTNA